MKIIFLDIDGVLNHRQFLIEAERVDAVSDECIARLNRIIEATGAKCVLSSTWRVMFPLEEILNDFLIPGGFKGEIVGKTPPAKFSYRPRGNEIQEWLDDHPEVTKFVILDDEEDMLHLENRLIRTSFEDGGLLDEHVEEAISMLKED